MLLLKSLPLLHLNKDHSLEITSTETMPLSLIIPEEARICDTGVFRLRDGASV